ncbi:uncharacterized protein LOC132265632 [Phlebotomus argentipes]|uniref:uncharacterized protein LOC132265632 n=1 Tax=Phlebotomus argentipes TaxID=94469 RepID=UPI002892BEED|nr:uncharacterized protein LOC132265632 [Phlebotomus argentipes]
MPFGRRSPLEALALPGVILAYKYSQFRQRRREAANRRVTERELTALHHKIDKLLNKLEESEPEPPTSQEDECVICINARATMQTSPCGHRVVCRRCFVKTIQAAVAQRLLPLRCVICRARINRLTSGSGSWRLQGSASSYSMGSSKSWGVPGSASAYSMNSRVAQSASLYSMSSGSSCVSGVSNTSSCSENSTNSGLSSTSSASSLHKHNGSCPSGCLGAIPRNPAYLNRPSKERVSEIMLRSRLPTIKEFRSPARRLPTPSPVHATNPRLRYGTYTGKSSSPTDIIPLLVADASSSAPPGGAKSLGVGSKVAPIRAKSPMSGKSVSVKSKSDLPAPSTSKTAPAVVAAAASASREDKKEEKARLKAEKEMRKEEKRIAKEEERLAKMLAKEEKKRRKKEASAAKSFFG